MDCSSKEISSCDFGHLFLSAWHYRAVEQIQKFPADARAGEQQRMWRGRNGWIERDINFNNEKTCHITFVFINPSALFMDQLGLPRSLPLLVAWLASWSSPPCGHSPLSMRVLGGIVSHWRWIAVGRPSNAFYVAWMLNPKNRGLPHFSGITFQFSPASQPAATTTHPRPSFSVSTGGVHEEWVLLLYGGHSSSSYLLVKEECFHRTHRAKEDKMCWKNNKGREGEQKGFFYNQHSLQVETIFVLSVNYFYNSTSFSAGMNSSSTSFTRF